MREQAQGKTKVSKEFLCHSVLSIDMLFSSFGLIFELFNGNYVARNKFLKSSL